MIDLSTPQARIAQHYMRDVKGINVEPHDVTPLHNYPCWYFYYALPDGELELEVFWDEQLEDWTTTVTATGGGVKPA